MTQLEKIRQEQFKELRKRDVDQVQVRDDLIVGEKYGGLTWLDYLEHCAEVRKFVFKVKEVIVKEDGKKIYCVTLLNSQVVWQVTEKMIVQFKEAENEWN